jgi:hypothetical protein
MKPGKPDQRIDGRRRYLRLVGLVGIAYVC